MVTKSTRRKSFTSAPVEAEPIVFDINGEEFEARPAIPGAVILDFLGSSEDEGAGAAKQITEFYRSVLLPESYERFEKLVRDPEISVSLELLTEIVGWLVEEYTARPTKES